MKSFDADKICNNCGTIGAWEIVNEPVRRWYWHAPTYKWRYKERKKPIEYRCSVCNTKFKIKRKKENKPERI